MKRTTLILACICLLAAAGGLVLTGTAVRFAPVTGGPPTPCDHDMAVCEWFDATDQTLKLRQNNIDTPVVGGLPSQGGHANQFLATNGSAALWTDPSNFVTMGGDVSNVASFATVVGISTTAVHDLSFFTGTPPTDKQALIWVNASNDWEPQAIVNTFRCTSGLTYNGVACDNTIKSGPVQVGLDLGHANTWLATQAFGAGTLKVNNSAGTFGTTLATNASAARTWTFPDATDTAVGQSRQILTAAGDLTGGGDLSADRTLALATTAVTPGTYPSDGAHIPTIIVDGKGRLTSANGATSIAITESQVTNLTTDLAAKVPTTRNVSTSSPLGGGGALSGDLTLTCVTCVTSASNLTTGGIVFTDATSQAVKTNPSNLAWDNTNFIETIEHDNLTTTETIGTVLLNNTASLVGTQKQYSPGLDFKFHQWNSSVDKIKEILVTGQGAVSGSNALSQLVFSVREGATGSFSDYFFIVNDSPGLMYAYLNDFTNTVTMGIGISSSAEAGSGANHGYLGPGTNHDLVIRTNNTARARFPLGGGFKVYNGTPAEIMSIVTGTNYAVTNDQAASASTIALRVLTTTDWSGTNGAKLQTWETSAGVKASLDYYTTFANWCFLLPSGGGYMDSTGAVGIRLTGTSQLDFYAGSTVEASLTTTLFSTAVGRKYHITAVSSSPYTVLGTDHVIDVDTTSARTLNLPAAALGTVYIIEDGTGTAGTNAITIAPNGADLINGANSSFTISANFGRVILICRAANKWIKA